MSKLERWALATLIYTICVSLFRHSLWMGLNEITILLSLFENIIAIIAFFPAFIFHKTCVTPDKSWVWYIPLAGWVLYAVICFIFKILSLTILFL